jgi:hypothetical protein
MAEEIRPVNHEVDCETGGVTSTPLSDEEWEALKQRHADAMAEQQQEAAEREKLIEAVKAHPDPVVKELAKLLGIN